MRDLEAFSWNGNIYKKLQISHKTPKGSFKVKFEVITKTIFIVTFVTFTLKVQI